MARVALAGSAYFAAVFVAAFAFGAVRTFWLEPLVGETWAVAAEAPLRKVRRLIEWAMMSPPR